MSLQTHHSHSLTDVPETVRDSREVAMRFRRRILHPRKIAKWEAGTTQFRMFKVGSMVALGGILSYMALFVDFGPKEHVFTPVPQHTLTTLSVHRSRSSKGKAD
ncbi:hypothetical protein HDU98_011845 [Podochytrium sp. JEL0797]|nr:hypothetical protein HDU98_011845 [Podochytrium sp. JEL0797]